MDTLLTFVTDGIIERPVTRKPPRPISRRFGIGEASR